MASAEASPSKSNKPSSTWTAQLRMPVKSKLLARRFNEKLMLTDTGRNNGSLNDQNICLSPVR